MTNYPLFSRFALVVALVLLQGCGGGSSSNPPPPPPPPTGPEFLYIGTDNSQPGNPPGNPTEIVSFAINPNTGALGTPTVMATGPVRGSVADPFGRALYTADGATGAIHEYTINGTTGALTEVSGSPFSVPTSPPLQDPTPHFGADPYTDLLGNFVYLNNCGLRRNSAGTLAPITGGGCFPGTGGIRTVAHPSGKFLIQTCDMPDVTLISNPICVAGANPSTGQLLKDPNPIVIQLTVASDVAVHPSGNFVYMSAGTDIFPPTPSPQGIAAFNFDAGTGLLQPASGGADLPVPNQLSALAMTPNGKFLYAVDNTNMYVFAITPGGALLPISGSPFPFAHQFRLSARAFQIDNTGQFLYLAARDINAVIGFKIDPNTGNFTAIPGSPFPIGATPQTMAVVRTP
ncbi:MAG: lactonase family protein [Candidatus Angelobacter sp.]